jgi:hypothetical protein
MFQEGFLISFRDFVSLVVKCLFRPLIAFRLRGGG